jgi:hypothetical protein
MKRCLLLIITSIVVSSSAMAQVNIPEHHQFGQYLNMNEYSSYAAVTKIPSSSLDTAGNTDASDTINYYINQLSQKEINYLAETFALELPSGTFLILKPINLKSHIKLKGAGAGKTFIKCQVGEGNPCISLSPANEGNSVAPIDTFMLLRDAKKRDGVLILDSTGYQKYDDVQERTTSPYLISIVKNNDSELINDRWAEQSVRESFSYSFGYNVENGAEVHLPIGDFYRALDDPRIEPTYKLTHNYEKDSSHVFISNCIFNSGVNCLSIKRADTTTSQTANILMRNAVNCNIIGVESNQSNFAHIDLRNSVNCLIKRNLIRFGNNYGGGGKAYGIVLQSGSCRNNVVDNVLHHLRHSILLQSGANNNIIFANYSFDPFWEQAGLPSDAAGDIVLHGNYPFANVFEANVAQQIVIDDSHGKNGPFNIFHRNWLQGYGIFMSAANGSDSQVFTGNEITNTAFLKGLYLLQDQGHFEYGNWVKGNNQPSSTSGSLQRSISMENQFYEDRLRRTGGWWALTSFLNKDSIPFGEPLNAFEKSIPALKRDMIFPNCWEFDDTYQLGIKDIKSTDAMWFYPNPTIGKVHITEPGLLHVYNLQGQQLKEISIQQLQVIDLSMYHGLLILTLQTDSQKLLTGKLNVQ